MKTKNWRLNNHLKPSLKNNLSKWSYVFASPRSFVIFYLPVIGAFLFFGFVFIVFYFLRPLLKSTPLNTLSYEGSVKVKNIIFDKPFEQPSEPKEIQEVLEFFGTPPNCSHEINNQEGDREIFWNCSDNLKINGFLFEGKAFFSSLENFKNLQQIELKNNYIESVNIASLSNLSYLDVRGNPTLKTIYLSSESQRNKVTVKSDNNNNLFFEYPHETHNLTVFNHFSEKNFLNLREKFFKNPYRIYLSNIPSSDQKNYEINKKWLYFESDLKDFRTKLSQILKGSDKFSPFSFSANWWKDNDEKYHFRLTSRAKVIENFKLGYLSEI